MRMTGMENAFPVMRYSQMSFKPRQSKGFQKGRVGKMNNQRVTRSELGKRPDKPKVIAPCDQANPFANGEALRNH